MRALSASLTRPPLTVAEFLAPFEQPDLAEAVTAWRALIRGEP